MRFSKSRRSTRRSTRRYRKHKKIGVCEQRIREKIAVNMKELKDSKKFYSAKQAKYVARLQVAKMFPRCKKYINESSKKYYRKKSRSKK